MNYDKKLQLGKICGDGAYEWPLDYLHMNRFRIINMFKLDLFRKYDYMLQMDSDASFTKVKEDIFAAMVINKKSFMYYVCDNDATCTNNLYETAFAFTKKYSIKWKNKHLYGDPNMFQGTLLAFKTSWFRPENKQLWKLLSVIDESGGIYFYRWGDQAVFLMALSIFMDNKEIGTLGNYTEITHYGSVLLPSYKCPPAIEY